MDKKLLAKKLLSFRKSQLNEYSLNPKTDEGLGNWQDILSIGSGVLSAIPIPGAAIANHVKSTLVNNARLVALAAVTAAPVPGIYPPGYVSILPAAMKIYRIHQVANRIKTIGIGGAAAVNLARQELDKRGIVPSTSGDLKTQGNMLSGLAMGSILRNSVDLHGAPGTSAIARWGLGAGVAAGLVPGLQGIAGIAGMTKIGVDDLLLSVASSETLRRNADSISKATGLPLIPGLSKTLTQKQPLGTLPSVDVARSPNQLELVAAANASRSR